MNFLCVLIHLYVNIHREFEQEKEEMSEERGFSEDVSMVKFVLKSYEFY